MLSFSRLPNLDSKTLISTSLSKPKSNPNSVAPPLTFSLTTAMALDPNKYQNTKPNYHDRGVSPSNFPRNSGPESHRWFSPQEDMENEDFHGNHLGMSDGFFASVGFADLSDRGVLKERNRNSFGSRERKSHDSGRESHCLFTPQENIENKGFHGKELGISDASFASIGHGELSDRGVLSERNRNFFESRERELHNSGTYFGSFSYGDRSKHHRIRSEEDLMGFECDLGFIYKSNPNSNCSMERTFQDVGCDFKQSTIASEENFVNKSNLETGSRPLCRVASEGNLNELESKFKLGSNLERRSVSPKVRTSLTPKMVSDLSETKRCRCVHELSVDRKDTQINLSPNCGLYFSPNRNPSSNRTKPSYTRRMEYLSPRHQCLCYKSKSHKRDAYSSHSLQEKIIQQSLSDELERNVNPGTKGNSGLSKIWKCAIFCVLLVTAFLFAPIKERCFLIAKFGAWNSLLEINHTDSFLNRFGMGSNYSEDANSERQIEPSIEKEGSCRGEMEKEIKSFTLNKNATTEEVQTLEEANLTKLLEEENDGHEELKSESIDEFRKAVHVPHNNIGYVALVQVDTNNTVEDREIQTHGEDKDGHKELQSESEDEFKIDEKQCGVLDFTADRLEGPVPIPDRKNGYVALVQADANIKVEDRKVEMRIRFCMAFVSVAVFASVVSCIVKREQFGEMLYRCSSLKKGRKSSNKEPKRENSVVLEGSYGSIVTYEKIPAKKRGGHKDGFLTPVRRSSRIRNYLASPS